MDTTSILTKTAQGMLAAKTEGGDLNYDAVRLLRRVDGKASVGALRAQFADITDTRFEKALAMLEKKGLIRALAPEVDPVDERFDAPKLDAQMNELAQELLQTLDFTTLERKLVEAMRSSPSKSGVAAKSTAPEQPRAAQQDAAAIARREPDAKAQPSRDRLEAEALAKLMAELRPKVEEELRAQLIVALRPKVEEELRRKLIVALRPALEAEIRTKLTAALLPRVKQQVLAQLDDQPARASPAQIQPRQEPSAHAATLGPSRQDSVASAILAQQQSLKAMQEAAFQTDLAGKNVYVNQAWTQLTGYSVDDTLGRPLAEFFIAEVRRGVAICLDRVARGRTTQSFVEAYLARKADGPLRVEVRAAPLTTTAGDIIGVCGTLRDAGTAQEREKGT